MLVSELINALKQYDQEAIVVFLDGDMGFWPVIKTEEAIYVEKEHEIYFGKITPKLAEQGYNEENVYSGKGGQKATVLWS